MEPAETKVSWTGPILGGALVALTLGGALVALLPEEAAQEGAGEEQALARSGHKGWPWIAVGFWRPLTAMIPHERQTRMSRGRRYRSPTSSGRCPANGGLGELRTVVTPMWREKKEKTKNFQNWKNKRGKKAPHTSLFLVCYWHFFTFYAPSSKCILAYVPAVHMFASNLLCSRFVLNEYLPKSSRSNIFVSFLFIDENVNRFTSFLSFKNSSL